jgi:hypothetical protein
MLAMLGMPGLLGMLGLLGLLGLLGAGACNDAPPRPAPRPSAPAQASRAMVTQAMIAAVANAERARRELPGPAPLPEPMVTVVPDDDVADRLSALDLAPDDDPDDDPDNDPDDGVVGGVLGAPDPSVVPGGIPSYAQRSSDVSVQLLGDSDDLDADALRRYTNMVRMRAELCRRQAIADDELRDEITATVSLTMSPRGARAVHVSGGGVIADCLDRLYVPGDLPLGATLTYQITIPAP